MATGERVAGKKYKHATDSSDSECQVCKNKKRKYEMKFCHDCSIAVCSTCSESHETDVDHSTHIVGILQGSSIAIDDYLCAEHPAKQITTFCQEHDKLCCEDCVTQHHGSCELMQDFDQHLELTGPVETSEVLTKLKSAKESVLTTIRAYQSVKEIICKEKERAITAIKEFRISLEKSLEELEKSTIRMLSAKCEQIEADFKENAEAVEGVLSNIARFEQNLEELTLDNKQKFLTLKLAERQIKLSQPLSEMALKPTVEVIKFRPNAKIQELLEELDKLGTCNFFPNLEGRSSDIIEPVHTSTGVPVYPSTMVCSGQIKSDLTVPEDENTCYTSGMCICPDGTVLCVDNENMKLKRLEEKSYKVQDFIELQETPLDVAAIGNTEAIVSMGENIQFVSIGASMQKTRVLNFKHECQFLAYHDSKIFVSDGGCEIYLYSIMGTLLSKILIDMFVAGIACDETGSMLYISDDNEPALAAFDLHGVMVWKQTGQDLSMASPSGVCCDGFGNVLACGRSRDETSDLVARVQSNGVYDGSWDGGFDHYYKPTCVCFDRNKLKIIVANDYGKYIVINDMQ